MTAFLEGRASARPEGAEARPSVYLNASLNPSEVSGLCIARRVHPGVIADRQREPKGASFSGFALNADPSLMRFHSKPAKGEPQASRMPMFAAAVCLSKFFKDVFVLLARYPFSVVANGNGDVSPLSLKIYTDCSI